MVAYRALDAVWRFGRRWLGRRDRRLVRLQAKSLPGDGFAVSPKSSTLLVFSSQRPRNEKMPKKIWRYTLLSLIGLLFAWLGVHTGLKLLRQPTFDDAILFGVCVFISLRIGYELTLHRASAPVIASSYPARRRMARILKQDADARKVTPYTVVDLGSGCGELVRFIARAIPQANVVGIENAFW